MKVIRIILVLVSLVISSPIFAQSIPSNKVLDVNNLSNYLNSETEAILSKRGVVSTSDLALYFREKFAERYFYDWKNFDKRFEAYREIYPSSEDGHSERALDHMAKYSGDTQWKLPFNYLFGEPVNAYALRHLARQHKMVDIAFYYNYQDKNLKYLSYFKEQQKSLNSALDSGEFEKIEDGNGVYEAFRSGYRILNWLQIHNMFLGEESYSDEDQLRTIATLLQHGAHLYERNQEFHSGNHQTRGLSALAMVSILLRDFEGADIWYNHAMKLLEEHLTKEINDDGFQFERTVHYHISDIGNFYYVYQLAKNSNLEVSTYWEDKLKSLFTTLIKIAYPDKSAPVLSDDTAKPWGEKNDISNALTLGYLLFEEAEMGYFANNQVEAKMFWYVSDSQLEMLKNIQTKKPEYKSIQFPTTGYYIMRDGWNTSDNMMIISAGLDDLKPDHQHGDMLGIQAMVNGKVILPNYQVRYYLKDLELFKNSMTKNVALVDDELQGKQYTSNKGGSGFGKFKKLPNPEVVSWFTNDDIKVFVGSHDGFEEAGVDYSRQVISIENKFWIVKDNFSSNEQHEYKQVWQGHYTTENGSNLIRSSFDNGSGLDIYQLNSIDDVKINGARGKQWSILSKNEVNNFSFITVLAPFSNFEKRINEDEEVNSIMDWSLIKSTSELNVVGYLFEKENIKVAFDVTNINLKEKHIEFESPSDVFLIIENDQVIIRNIQSEVVKLNFEGTIFEIAPSQSQKIELK
ncbi:MAG: heparinase [Lutibacter sp.]|uniref:heparinase II/III family protein n=1 Tax=Lutibacter sp. TaxID=1925666 RepID=UPI0017DA3C7B|nr:heparinase II/III family protein [Lutibacter sp.]MBT8316061.1 heparinase II/III family protein [Lutibacter sp.]NNJ56921.1 heparinase [Lutibacter sp.]